MLPGCIPNIPRCYPFESPIHEFPYDTHPHLRDYNRIERRRVRRLGLEPRFARRQDVTRMIRLPPVQPSGGITCPQAPVLPIRWTNTYAIRAKVIAGNSYAPFGTMQKVYWSPFLKENADHRMKKFGHIKPLDEDSDSDP